jgi:hypothetical protein
VRVHVQIHGSDITSGRSHLALPPKVCFSKIQRSDLEKVPALIRSVNCYLPPSFTGASAECTPFVAHIALFAPALFVW